MRPLHSLLHACGGEACDPDPTTRQTSASHGLCVCFSLVEAQTWRQSVQPLFPRGGSPVESGPQAALGHTEWPGRPSAVQQIVRQVIHTAGPLRASAGKDGFGPR